MAPSVMADASSVKANKCLNPSRKVRVVGKIRGFMDKESLSLSQDSKPWITVKKREENESSERCTVFIENQSTSRKEAYELDYCYEQDDDIGNIYSRDIKPLISTVFDGQNASVIALGTRRSGKTFNIQGSQENPGLAVIAMSEILSKARELDKSVSISLFELAQDQVYDLLNPKSPVVQVLEDARGKVNLKGLSQVTITSVSEFQNIYLSQGGPQNTKRISTDQTRNHKGLMVYVASEDAVLKTKKINKINFINLAGYEDPRKSNRDGIKLAEGNRARANKSLYALLNVVSAINANVIRIPYRESKLTRILQDSLGGTSHVLLLTCLNPLFCQDSISMLNLIVRSCRSAKDVLIDSTNRIQSSTKSKVNSSVKSGKAMSASLSLRKQISSSQIHLAKKAKGRKLFDDQQKGNDKQLRCEPEDCSAQEAKIDSNIPVVVAPFSLNRDLQDQSMSEGTMTIVEDVKFEEVVSESMAELQSTLQSSLPSDESASTVKPDGCPPDEIDLEEATPVTNSAPSNILRNANSSPPLSERIREISDNFKSLMASTPLTVEVSEREMQLHSSEAVGYNYVAEPKTPSMVPSNVYCTPRATFSNMNCTPQAIFSNHSSRMKDSLVQNYLNFLNSANKEELKSIKGIGEKRATKILQLRGESPQHFKDLDDLRDIGLSSNQVKNMMKDVAGDLFK